jgi:ubiquinone/menaquinone biosynthesis C-methylase UbiE
MSSGLDPDYLRHEQYRDPTNLTARISLHERFSVNCQPFAAWLMEQLELPPEADLLELGAGTGVFWRVNAEELPPGWRLTITDLSGGMVEAARANLADLPNAMVFDTVDAQAIPFADASFDCVLANFMLYHVPDRRRAFAEMHRVLRPGGLLAAATNGSAHLREIRDLERRFGLATVFGGTTSAQAFGLQNGAEQMAPWFDQIECLRRDDALEVPEVDALIDHIRSKLLDPEADAVALTALRQYLEGQLAADGVLRVTKASGAFLARRREL